MTRNKDVNSLMKKYLIWLLIIILLSLGVCRGLRFYWLQWPPATFPLALKWEIDLGQSTYDRPAYQDELVFMPVDTWLYSHWYGIEAEKGVVALDRKTFTAKWIYQPQRKLDWYPLVTLSQVAILDHIGYAIFSDATLRAFDLETGRELGYWQPGRADLWWWPICMPPTIPGCIRYAKVGLTTTEDTLFVSFGDGKLYAFSQSP